jgi:trans-aconitate 2-methyltransferase
MVAWDANQYLKFEDERTRPARDLLAQVPHADARFVYDLGCGPGNSTGLLAARFPHAQITGLDSSAEMLRQARKNLPAIRFEEADLATWTPSEPAEVLFANAVFQWVPDHTSVLQRLLANMPQGGVLAVQMPDNLDEPTHILMREIAAQGAWVEKIAAQNLTRAALLEPAYYYDLLQPYAAKLDIWHTIYNHVLADAVAIVEWVMGTGLRPYLAPLDVTEKADYLAAYTEAIAQAYPPHIDGRVLLRFPRLFIVAVRG